MFSGAPRVELRGFCIERNVGQVTTFFVAVPRYHVLHGVRVHDRQPGEIHHRCKVGNFETDNVFGRADMSNSLSDLLNAKAIRLGTAGGDHLGHCVVTNTLIAQPLQGADVHVGPAQTHLDGVATVHNAFVEQAEHGLSVGNRMYIVTLGVGMGTEMQ